MCRAYPSKGAARIGLVPRKGGLRSASGRKPPSMRVGSAGSATARPLLDEVLG